MNQQANNLIRARLVLLILSGVLASLSAGATSISGTITDSVSGDPIAGVTVFISGVSNVETLTDASGNYTAAGLFPDFYTVQTAGTTGYVDRIFPDANTDLAITTSGTPGLVDATSDAIAIDFQLQPCLYCDDYSSGVLDPDLTPVKGSWSVVSNELHGQSTKKALLVASPQLPDCTNCVFEAFQYTAGGRRHKVSFFGWYKNAKNNVELLIKEDEGKVILKRRLNGKVQKQTGEITITPGLSVFYYVILTFDGTSITGTVITFENIQTFAVLTIPLGTRPPPLGTLALQVVKTTGMWPEISVHVP